MQQTGPSTESDDTGDLEKPPTAAALYLARDEDTDEVAHRPRFTGDVLRLPDGRLVALVQHPCTVANAPQGTPLLVCAVAEANGPGQWRGSYRLMPLPELIDGRHCEMRFDELELLDIASAISAARVAVLSQLGVNLLVQRWTHHNTRVVVRTLSINRHTAGPVEEADLVGDLVGQLTESGVPPVDARASVDAWLDEVREPPRLTYRRMLDEPQSRSTVRAAARRHVRGLIAGVGDRTS